MADHPGRHSRRTWPERLAIAGTFLSAVVCLAIAAALVVGYLVVRQRNIAELENPAEVAAAAAEATGPAEQPATMRPTTSAAATAPTEPDVAGAQGPTTTGGSADDTAAEQATSTVHESDDRDEDEDDNPSEQGPQSTFPEADPQARNFLITGADNGACIDPDSPYFGAFGDREGMGERSDTIMVLRVDPAADRVAVLSFPRDLYVEIADSGGMSRINSAYRRNEPQRLADTIYNNFGIGIDHFIQVDFCAFKTLVNAVGGVSVPFEFPTRDGNTGLEVLTTGCFEFDGEHALAYVRSRHYQYEDPPGSDSWQEDPSSDLGRISRQQDFLRRTLSSILDDGPLKPRVARGLIRAATAYVVTDADLTPARMMEFAGVMNDVDPVSILTYQVESSARNINGASVLVPNIESENMQAVLALFRGETSLADARVQVIEETTTVAPRGASTTSGPVASSEPAGSITEAPATSAAPDHVETTAATETSGETTATESVPVDGPPENQVGIVPPRDVTC
jgi:LCP family protein required for cell wall assembly